MEAPCLTFVSLSGPLPPGPCPSWWVAVEGSAAAACPAHTILLSALEFTPDQQPLHFTLEFSIFYFLSHSSTALPHAPSSSAPPSFPLPPPLRWPLAERQLWWKPKMLALMPLAHLSIQFAKGRERA